MNYCLRLIVVIMMLPGISAAQIFKKKFARADEQPPKALLIQLPTYKRKIDHYNKTGKNVLARQLEADRDSVITKIVADFSKNFSFCPIWFYHDTNAVRIANKQFNGIILDKNLKPATANITSSDSDYFAVMFGYDYHDFDETNEQQAYSNIESRQKLIVLNSSLKRLSNSYFNNIPPSGSKQRIPGPYAYYSSRFDIYYRPYARQLSARLYRYFRENTRE
jgi:hypothetical protein